MMNGKNALIHKAVAVAIPAAAGAGSASELGS